MRARFDVLVNNAERVVIRDRKEKGTMTVTNDAEAVVAHLRAEGVLTDGKRLFYFDTAGDLDEITWTENGAVDFRPGPGFWPTGGDHAIRD